MVYSFFHPGEDARSLGTHMILDHIEAARARGLPYVYLGYWVRGQREDGLQVALPPLEALGPRMAGSGSGGLVALFDTVAAT